MKTWQILTSLFLAAMAPDPLFPQNESLSEVFLNRGRYQEYDCSTKEKVRGSQLPSGALIHILGESGEFLHVENLETATNLCIRGRKRDMTKIPALSARDGSTPLFAGRSFGVVGPRIKAPGGVVWGRELSELAEIPVDPIAWVIQLVERDGSSSHCQILISSGWKEFDDYALRKACKGPFFPAKKGNEPVPIIRVEPVARR